MNETAPEHSVRDHATLGGSKASIWSSCPGSIFYLRDLPPELPSEDAERGTRAHENCECALSSFLHFKETGEQKLEFCHKDLDLIEVAENYTVAVWEKVLSKSITNKAYGLEEKFTIDQKLEMYGYVDFWCAYTDEKGKRVGCVVDFKSGYNLVGAEKNAQLAFYAVALREEIRKLEKDFDYVRGIIIQINSGGQFYSETKFSAKQLDTWKKRFLKAAHQVFVKQKPKFKVGSHCRWCRAQAICKAYNKEISAEQALILVEPDVNALPKVESINDETLVKIVLHDDKISKFLKSCKSYAKARMLSNNPISGLKFVAGGPGKRKWPENEAEVEANLKAVGIKEPKESVLRGIGSIERELKTLHGKEDAKNILEKITLRGNSSPLLVSADDERPAVDISDKLLTEEE